MPKARAPRFIKHPDNVEVKVGKKAVIYCTLDEGEPEPDIDWYFEGKIIKDAGRFRYLFEDNDEVGLEILQVTVEDEGEYKIVAKNESGKVSSSCELLVNVAGKIVDAPRDAEYEENGIALFKCKYDGYPHPIVKWFQGKKEIKSGGKYLTTTKHQESILEIDDLTLDDGGFYSLVVSNDSGEDEVTVRLTVYPDKKKTQEKKEPVKSAQDDFNKKAAGRLFTPAGRKKKKSKLPIDREGIKAENPEQYYEFGEEIGRGKFSIVKKCVDKRNGGSYAAKIIKFDTDSLKFAIREYDLMTSGRLSNRGFVQLHEAYLVRKYLVLIMDLVDGKTLLQHVSNKHSLNEDEIAGYIKQILEILADAHKNNVIHLDIRSSIWMDVGYRKITSRSEGVGLKPNEPTNIRFANGRDLKILDYNSARQIANKKAGEVVDVIGDTEFCAPELLMFDPVKPESDLWSVAVITYTLLSGISPFYYEDEEEVLQSVQNVKWSFDEDAFDGITSEAKNFLKKIFVRVPEMRLTAEKALEHKWLSADYKRNRVNSKISRESLNTMKETDERLYSEEEEDYIEASLVFRTFDEDEYDSPEEEDDEEE